MAGDPNQYQNIFNAYVQQTPDGRYFVPVSATNLNLGGDYNSDAGSSVWYTPPTDPQAELGQGGGQMFTNFNDYYNALDPNAVAITGGVGLGGAQVALGNIGAQRGSYNGQLGYYVDPTKMQGWNPATTAGSKPNDNGLWQALSIIAPAAFGVGSFAADGLATGGSAVTDTGALAGGGGSTTLSGGAAGDTAVSGGTAAQTGGNMDFITDPNTGDVTLVDNSMGGFVTDPNTGDVVPASSSASSGGGFDLGGGLSVDQFGNVQGGLFEGGPGTVGAGDFFNPGASDPTFMSLIQKYGTQIGKMIYSALGGGSGGASSTGGLVGGNGASLGSILPGVLALGYASQQQGIDTSKLSGVFDAAGANAPLFTQAAIDPVQKNIAAGYGDLLQSQALRGIRGSSFGATDIANYMDTTNRTLGDVGATAAQKSLGLQGDLASQIAQLQAQSQQMKNSLYGRAFDVLGRGLNPKGYGGLTLSQ